MKTSIRASTKKRGRPPTTGKGVQIGVRLQSPDLPALDKWIETQPEPRPTRPEAIRIGVRNWLSGLGLLPGAAPEQIAKTIQALEDEHAEMGAKPSPKKALNRMKAAIAKDGQKKKRT